MNKEQLKAEIIKVAKKKFGMNWDSNSKENQAHRRDTIRMIGENLKNDNFDSEKPFSKLNVEELSLILSFLMIETKRNDRADKVIADYPKEYGEKWEDYYIRLLDLGFKKTSIQKWVTVWKKDFEDVPNLPREWVNEINASSEQYRNYKTSFNCTIKEENYLFFIEELEHKARSFGTKLLYLLAVTGRRQSEVLTENAFTFKDRDKKIIFNNQLKTKSREVEPYKIPYLGDYETIKRYHADVIEELTRAEYKSNHIRSIVFKTFENAKPTINATVGGLLKAHNLRALYLLYIHNNYSDFFQGAKTNIINLDMRVLGHGSQGEIVNYLGQVILSKDQVSEQRPFLNVYGGDFDSIEDKILNNMMLYGCLVPHLEEIKKLIKELYRYERNSYILLPEMKSLSSKKKKLIRELLTIA